MYDNLKEGQKQWFVKKIKKMCNYNQKQITDTLRDTSDEIAAKFSNKVRSPEVQQAANVMLEHIQRYDAYAKELAEIFDPAPQPVPASMFPADCSKTAARKRKRMTESEKLGALG